MAKKNDKTKEQEPNFEGLAVIGNTPKPTIEKSTKQKGESSTKKKKGKPGPQPVNPENWVKIWIKIDPKIKDKLKGMAGANSELTPSIIVNNALKKYLK